MGHLPMKEKNIRFESGRQRVWPMPAKTAEKAEKHIKEGPINTSIGKSRADTVSKSS